MFNTLRSYIFGITMKEMEAITHANKQMMPYASDITYAMSVEYAYRTKTDLQEVLNIQKNN